MSTKTNLAALLTGLGMDPSSANRDSVMLRSRRTFIALKAQAGDATLRYRSITSDEFVGDLKNLDIVKYCPQSMRDIAQFQSVFEQFTSSTLTEFLHDTTPNFAVNIEGALKAITPYFTNEQDIITQLLAIKYTAYLHEKKKKSTGSQTWNTYLELTEKEQFTPLKEDVFSIAFEYIHHYILPYNWQKHFHLSGGFGCAQAAVQIFSQLGLTEQQQMKIAVQCFCNTAQPADVAADFFEQSELMSNYKPFLIGYKSLINSSPLSTLIKLKVNPHETDLPLELGLILPRLLRSLGANSSEKSLVIYDANPVFVKEYIAHFTGKAGPKTTFVFSDALTSKLFHTHYTSETYTTRTLKGCRFLSKKQWKTTLENRTSSSYDSLLLFASPYLDASKNFVSLCQKNSSENFKVFVMVATVSSENSKAFLRCFGHSMGVEEVDLLPQGITLSTIPRRKLLLIYSVQPPQKAIKLAKYSLASGAISNAKTLLTHRGEEDIFLSESQLYGAASFRTAYREHAQKKTSEAKKKKRLKGVSAMEDFRTAPRRQAAPYEFCREISFWYATSEDKKSLEDRPRITAYCCQPPTEIQRKRNGLARGKVIPTTKKSTTKVSYPEIESWLEHTYALDVREQIGEELRPNFANKPISLKLFWYLHPSMEDIYSQPILPLFTELICSPIGYLQLDTTADVFESVLEKSFPDASSAQLDRYWDILGMMVDFAVEKEYIKVNPLLEWAIYYGKKERNYMGEIRGALVKRSFTKPQLSTALQLITQQINTGHMEWLGVYIRIITGLEPNIICALRWSDFTFVPQYHFYQLWIARQVTNDGLDIRAMGDRQDYRCIPCIPTLTQALLHQKKQVEALCFGGQSSAKLQKMPIVTTADYLQESVTHQHIYSPADLVRRCKELVEQLDIPDQIIHIPAMDHGTKETNLSRYQGDIFRSNLQYYLTERDDPVVDIDDMMYLLGNRPKTTFGRHYYDFQNDTSQHRLWKSLQAWDDCLAHLVAMR